jgi:hypothetical protein
MAWWLVMPLLASACTFDPSTANGNGAGGGPSIGPTVGADAAVLDDGALAPDATPGDAETTCLTDPDYSLRPGSDHRYRFEGSGLVYDEAHAACAGQGAHLVVIDDQNENDYVSSLGGSPWIGLNDLEEEDSFAWVTGDPLNYENWAGNEPNDNGGDEDCTIFQGNWNDGECSNQREFVCECDPARQVPPPPACLASAAYSQVFQGRRYRAESTATSYALAEASCASEGGHLVVITDDTENGYVRSMISGNKWIGYNDIESEDEFVWVTGSPSSYNNWRDNQPDNSNGEDCVEADNNGDWNDRPCTDNRPYVCECDPFVRGNAFVGL